MPTAKAVGDPDADGNSAQLADGLSYKSGRDWCILDGEGTEGSPYSCANQCTGDENCDGVTVSCGEGGVGYGSKCSDHVGFRGELETLMENQSQLPATLGKCPALAKHGLPAY